MVKTKQKESQQKTPNLNFKILQISEHAYERAKERFDCRDKQHALNYCKSLLGDAEYIGLTSGEDGTKGHTYLKNRTAIIINPELTNIITIIEYDISGYEPLKETIKEIYKKEFRKLDRTEYSKTKRLERLKLQYNMEIAALKYRHYKTRSKAVKEFCDNEIKRLETELNKHEKEVKEIQSNKRQIARTIASVLALHNDRGSLTK